MFLFLFPGHFSYLCFFSAMALSRDTKSIELYISEALTIFKNAISAVEVSRVFYGVLLSLAIVMFFGACFGMNSWPMLFQGLIQIILVVISSYSLWSVVVSSANEINALRATYADMSHVLRTNPAQ